MICFLKIEKINIFWGLSIIISSIFFLPEEALKITELAFTGFSLSVFMSFWILDHDILKRKNRGRNGKKNPN